jgi:predicted O-methyltransferase YrrM
MSAQSPLTRVKQAYAASAKNVGRGLTRVGLASETVPPVDRKWRHWAHSLTSVHDSLAMAELDVPWWTYDAIGEVDFWLASRPGAVRVFEYGSGASTMWLARRVAEVHSVEHHRGFGEMMQGALASFSNVSLSIIEPVSSSAPLVGSQKEGHQGLDFADYVDAIDAVEGQFDLVVVDGRAREACLRKAIERLAPGGMIVFDNSRRRRYREAIAASGLRERLLRGLTPTLPYPEQTSLLIRG